MSFRELASNISILKSHITINEKTLADFINMIKLRINAEIEYINKLKEIGNSNIICESITLEDSINALKSDSLNHYKIRYDFINQIKDEVLSPCNELIIKYKNINNKIINDSQLLIDNFKIIRQQVSQAKLRVDRARALAIDSREKLLTAKLSNKGEKIIADLSAKVWSSLIPLSQCYKSYSMLLDSAQELKYDMDSQLENNLDVIAQNEESRLNGLKDAVRRHIVCETSLVCNRQYDLTALPAVAEAVDPISDMTQWANSIILSQDPIKSRQELEQLSMPREQIPPPYQPPNIKIRDDGSWFPVNQGLNSELEIIEEMCLSDLIVRAAVTHESTKLELKRVNEILGQLGPKSPHALMRVIVHVTKFSDIKINEPTFIFYSNLLKNMLNHFLQSHEMIAAQLVCFVSQRITKIVIVDDEVDESKSITAYSIIEKDCAAVADWEAKFFESYKSTMFHQVRDSLLNQSKTVVESKTTGKMYHQAPSTINPSSAKVQFSPNLLPLPQPKAPLSFFDAIKPLKDTSNISITQAPLSTGIALTSSSKNKSSQVDTPEEILEDCYKRYIDFQMDPADSFQLICNMAMLNSHFYNKDSFMSWAKKFIGKIPALNSVGLEVLNSVIRAEEAARNEEVVEKNDQCKNEDVIKEEDIIDEEDETLEF